MTTDKWPVKFARNQFGVQWHRTTIRLVRLHLTGQRSSAHPHQHQLRIVHDWWAPANGEHGEHFARVAEKKERIETNKNLTVMRIQTQALGLLHRRSTNWATVSASRSQILILISFKSTSHSLAFFLSCWLFIDINKNNMSIKSQHEGKKAKEWVGDLKLMRIKILDPPADTVTQLV